MWAKEKGDVFGKVYVRGQLQKLSLTDVLIVEDLKYNLISIARLEQKGFAVTFREGCCYVQKGDTVITVGQREGNIYKLTVFPVTNQEEASAFSTIKEKL